MNALVPIPGNVGTILTEAAASVRRDLMASTGSSFTSVEALGRVGQGLIIIRDHLPPRTFGVYVETNFGLRKQWRCRLMKLGYEWPNFLEAIKWANAIGLMTRSEYSVDGALALTKKWHRAQSGDAIDDTSKPLRGSSKRSESQESSDNSRDSSDKSIYLLALLLMYGWEELAQARAHICSLEAEIERLNRGRSENLSTFDINERFHEQADGDTRSPSFGGRA